MLVWRLDEESDLMRTVSLDISENGRYLTDLSVQNVKYAVESVISKLDDDNRLSEQAKTLHESERNCVFRLLLKPNRFSQLTDEMLYKSVADFVEDFKIFRPFDEEMVVLARYF